MIRITKSDILNLLWIDEGSGLEKLEFGKSNEQGLPILIWMVLHAIKDKINDVFL